MAVKKPTSSKTKRSIKVTKKTKAETTDFTDLDSAVSELAKQTAALLGDDSSPKPKLPKKKSQTQSGPKNFDIVHPKQVGSNPSVLKASPPASKKLTASDEKLQESGDSKTESDSTQDVSSVEDDDLQTSEVPKIISTHTAGVLHVASKTPRVSGVQDVDAESDPEVAQKDEDEIPRPEKATLPTVVDTKDDVKVNDSANSNNAQTNQDVVEDIKPSDSTTDVEPKITLKKPASDDSAIEHSEETTATITDDTSSEKLKVKVEDKSDESQVAQKEPLSHKPESDTTSDGSKATTVSTHADASQSVQLFSDNLDDKNTEDSDEEKTDVFDTDEYHPKLHDWSKLEHHNNAPVIVLLLLLVLFALGAYAVITGMKLPFIP